MNNPNTLIFVPTYNERENVERLCLELLDLNLQADILFLDDNSPDGTGDIIDRLAVDHENVSAIHRRGKLGIGSAHQDGINWAYDQGYRTLITMDCDFTHRPQDVPEFLRRSEDTDVVIGSRYMRDESLSDWTLFRKAMTSLGHFLTTTLLRMKYDATGAFRAYRLDNIPRETFTRVRSKSYSFFFESLYALHVNRHSIAEVPIALPARTYGHSKMRASDAIGSLIRLIILASTQLMTSRYKVSREGTDNAR
jgi:dolichol-phosphate mannosyltransferase